MQTDNNIYYFPKYPYKKQFYFTKKELSAIFSLYGQMVKSGLWKDYSIDALGDRTIFSVYKKSNTRPIYKIEKKDSQEKKRDFFRIISNSGDTLKRYGSVDRVVKFFELKKSA